jgi:hypothetical protein
MFTFSSTNDSLESRRDSTRLFFSNAFEDHAFAASRRKYFAFAGKESSLAFGGPFAEQQVPSVLDAVFSEH